MLQTLGFVAQGAAGTPGAQIFLLGADTTDLAFQQAVVALRSELARVRRGLDAASELVDFPSSLPTGMGGKAASTSKNGFASVADYDSSDDEEGEARARHQTQAASSASASVSSPSSYKQQQQQQQHGSPQAGGGGNRQAPLSPSEGEFDEGEHGHGFYQSPATFSSHHQPHLPVAHGAPNGGHSTSQQPQPQTALQTQLMLARNTTAAKGSSALLSTVLKSPHASADGLRAAAAASSQKYADELAHGVSQRSHLLDVYGQVRAMCARACVCVRAFSFWKILFSRYVAAHRAHHWRVTCAFISFISRDHSGSVVLVLLFFCHLFWSLGSSMKLNSSGNVFVHSGLFLSSSAQPQVRERRALTHAQQQGVAAAAPNVDYIATEAEVQTAHRSKVCAHSYTLTHVWSDEPVLKACGPAIRF
jgi:hypothetical protein